MSQSSSNGRNINKKNGLILDSTLDSDQLPDFFEWATTIDYGLFIGNQPFGPAFPALGNGFDQAPIFPTNALIGSPAELHIPQAAQPQTVSNHTTSTKVEATAGFSILGAPDGAVLAPSHAQPAKAFSEILVQFNLNATAAQKSAAIASVGGQIIETVRASDGEKGDLLLVKVNQPAADKVIEALSHNPVISFAENNWSVGVQLASNDPYYTGGNLWGMYGDQTSPSNAYGSQAGEAWAANHLGSTAVVIGDIDTGIDYTHIDLYQNIWLNQRELPNFAFVDTDSDGFITFRDLNQSQNASFVSDFNNNGRIDAGDLLQDTRYENGVDNDGNGYIDDLIGWDWVNNDNDPYDDNNHGTHTSGTIGATGFNGTGVIGVSPNVQLMALKFLSASGSGSTANAVRAQDYYTAASVANPSGEFIATSNSWGGGGYSQALMDSIIGAARKDILFVAAAGNNSANTDTTANYPSNYSTLTTVGYESVISVAAITSTGALASFSNYGASTVDLGAPGVSIYSTVAGGGYASYQGTSMATPHVAGALALYAAEHPDLSAAQLRDILLSSTVATASLSGKTVTGGRLNVDAMFDVIVTDPTPQVYISANAASLNEGNSGTTSAGFTIGLSMAMTTVATIDWALAGSGTNPASLSDFTGATSGTITFQPGVTQQTIQVSIVGDTTIEPNEQFTITLSNPSAGLSISQASATTTILNDEDDYSFDSTTTGVVTVNASPSTGIIDFASDADAFKISLVAGTSYLFNQNSTSSLDPYLYLYNSAFSLLASNDDSNGTLNSQIAYTATSTGTFYLGAKGYSTSVGSYSVNAVSQTTVNGTTGNDTLNGTFVSDTINGLAGNDILNGLNANDTLYGGDGNDILNGGAGADTQDGGNGSDLYMIDTASDYTGDSIADTGASGVDEVRFAATSASTLTLTSAFTGIEAVKIGTGTATAADTTATTAINVNASAVTSSGLNLVGNAGSNTLTGTQFADVLDGGLGADTLNGGLGDDTYYVDDLADVVNEVGGGGIDTVNASVSFTLATTAAAGVENLVLTGAAAINGNGNALSNSITGNSAANVIDGGDGDDTLFGNAGNDTLIGGNGADQISGGAGDDAIDGGAGSDTVRFDAAWSNIAYSYDATSAVFTFSGAAIGTDTVQNVEYFTDINGLTKSVSDLISDTVAPSLASSSPADEAVDVLASANIVLNFSEAVRAGTGSILINENGALWSTIDINDATQVTIVGSTVTINPISNFGSGKSYDVQFSSGVITDIAGNVFAGLSAGDLNFNAALTYNVINGSANSDTLTGTSSLDSMDGLGGNDNISGLDGNDLIYGGDGNDVLNGGAGNDLLDGGAGTDTASYAGTASAVTVDLRLSNNWQDTIGAGLDKLVSIENLTGGLGGDTLTGDGLANRIDGGAGDDLIDGGAGNDTLIGGTNSAFGDTVSYATATSAVTVSLAVTKAQSTGGSGSDTLSGFENLIGSNYNDTLTGTGGNNVINGGAGADIIVGGLGRDTLIGGMGNDVFDFNSISETGNSDTTCDVINDFLQGFDKIDLSTIDASSAVGGNNAFVFNGTGPITTSSSGEIRYQRFDNIGTDNDYTMIYGDTNATASAEFQIKLVGLYTLTASDFVL